MALVKLYYLKHVMDKILPSKYYLDHFLEFTEFLKSKYQHLFKDEHKQFLSQFDLLTEDAQCIYVRMANRKGKIFQLSDLIYDEIADSASAIQQLKAAGFVTELRPEHFNEFINQLAKVKLVELLIKAKATFKKSAKKSDLVETVIASLRFSDQALTDFISQVVVQDKNAELEYLLFLYFGEIKKNLALYTLRDLGIRQANEKRQSF